MDMPESRERTGGQSNHHKWFAKFGFTVYDRHISLFIVGEVGGGGGGGGGGARKEVELIERAGTR